MCDAADDLRNLIGYSVVLLRHGQSEANARKTAEAAAPESQPPTEICQRDPALTALGLAQAASWAPVAKDWLNLRVAFVSPLLRTLQTAAHVFSTVDEHRPRLVIAPEAREHWWSDLENRGQSAEALRCCTSELPSQFGKRLEGWATVETVGSRLWDPASEDLASKRELIRRAKDCTRVLIELLCNTLDELCATEGDGCRTGGPCAAVVCHWGVIAQLTDEDVSNCAAVFLNWKKWHANSDNQPGDDSETSSKPSRMNLALRIARDHGWDYTVTQVQNI